MASELEKNPTAECSESLEEAMSEAQRARAERSKRRALALREARPVLASSNGVRKPVEKKPMRMLDSGGGFLLEPDSETAPAAVLASPAPIVHRSEQPRCLHCGLPFPQSYLFDTFGYSACDACRFNSPIKSSSQLRIYHPHSNRKSQQGRRGRSFADHPHGSKERVSTEGLRLGCASAASSLHSAPKSAPSALCGDATVLARSGGGSRARRVGLLGGAGARAGGARRAARTSRRHSRTPPPARAAHGRALQSLRPHARAARTCLRSGDLRRRRRRLSQRVRVRPRRDLREDVGTPIRCRFANERVDRKNPYIMCSFLQLSGFEILCN